MRILLFLLFPLALFGQCTIPDSLASRYWQCYQYNDTYLILRRTPPQCEWRDAQWRALDLPAFWLERPLPYSQKEWVVRSSRAWGIFDLSTGVWKLPLEYDYISEFHEQRVCTVRKGEAEGLRNAKGEWLYEIAENQRFVVLKDVVYRTTWSRDTMQTHCRLLDKEQQRLGAAEYDFAENLGGDAWRVRSAGKEGVVNLEGKFLIPLKYDSVYYENNYIITKKAQQYGIYTQDYRLLQTPQFDAFQTYQGWGFIGEKGDAYEVFNKNGKRRFSYPEPLIYWNEGLYYVLEKRDTSYQKGDRLIYQLHSPGWWLDTSGRKVEFPLKNCIYTQLIHKGLIIKNKNQAMLLRGSRTSRFVYEDIVYKGGDWLAIRQHGRWGLMTQGELLRIAPQYAAIEALKADTWLVRDSTGHYGAVTSDNEPLIPLEYDTLFWLSRADVFVVRQAGKYGIYTQKGKKSLDCLYLDYQAGTDRIWLRTEQGWTLAAPSGRLLLSEPIAEMRPFDCDTQKKIARKGDKWGILDELSAQWFVPAQCDKIVADCTIRTIRTWMNGSIFCLDRNYQLIPCVD